MRTGDHRTVKHRLHQRRWAVMARYPVWDDDWVALLSDDDARRLLDIFEAIRRLVLGTYGICVVCATAIDPERLYALPEAGTCDVCAEFVSGRAAARSGTHGRAP